MTQNQQKSDKEKQAGFIGKTAVERGHRVCVAPMLDWTAQIKKPNQINYLFDWVLCFVALA